MASVALIYDEVFLKHNTGSHPENGERVRNAYAYVKSCHIFKSLNIVKPQLARDEEILLVHSEQYYSFIKSIPGDESGALDPDTMFGPGSLEAATFAAGAVTLAVRDIEDGEYDRAFCLVRPPGHHALADRAMGFCIFNNVAIGAAYATRSLGLDRVAIIDLDVHHGNGTQDMFYDDGDVLYCSIHQSPLYPGTGLAHERGRGNGEGATLNAPLPGGSGKDSYVEALTGTILPAIRAHGPSMVFLSAGFDAHEADPIGGMCLTTDAYRDLTSMIAEAATEICGGKIVSVLEGGYNHDALAASLHSHLGALLN